MQEIQPKSTKWDNEFLSELHEISYVGMVAERQSVGCLISLCDPIWQVMYSSSAMDFPQRSKLR